MTKLEFSEQVLSFLGSEDMKEKINQEVQRLMNSRALDYESYTPDNFAPTKMLVRVLFENLAYSIFISDTIKKDVNNLRKF